MSPEARNWPAEHGQLVAGVRPPGFSPVTEQALSDIVQRIVNELRPERIILFGSYGYGSPNENSDVDLLVIMETSSRPSDRYLAVSRLLRPRPFPLDILVKTPDEISQALEKGDFFIDYALAQSALRRKKPLTYGPRYLLPQRTAC
jgi:predicted nucleotidyltransferase